MYLEYETNYDLGQKLYQLDGTRIWEYQVLSVESTIKETCLEGGKSSTSTRYYIGRIGFDCDRHWFTQNEMNGKFYSDKKSILKIIADQL